VRTRAVHANQALTLVGVSAETLRSRCFTFLPEVGEYRHGAVLEGDE